MNQETGIQLTLVCAAGSFVRTVQTEMGQEKTETEKTSGKKRPSNFPTVVVYCIDKKLKRGP